MSLERICLILATGSSWQTLVPVQKSMSCPRCSLRPIAQDCRWEVMYMYSRTAGTNSNMHNIVQLLPSIDMRQKLLILSLVLLYSQVLCICVDNMSTAFRLERETCTHRMAVFACTRRFSRNTAGSALYRFRANLNVRRTLWPQPPPP